METYNIHTIKENETIEDISQFYNLSVNELIRFHNNNCKVEEAILYDITFQKQLYVPRIAVPNKDKLVPFIGDNTLKLNPIFYNLQYGVVITIEEEEIIEIKYEIAVKWLKTENNLHYFELDRLSTIYLNEEEVNNIADLLSYKASKVLYPLTICTDETGKFYGIDASINFEQRWVLVKEEIYKEFEGDIVEKYLSKMEKILLEDPDSIELYIKNDYFIRTLFFGVYLKYGKTFKIEGDLSFPIINNPIEPNYKIQLEIDPVLDDYNMIWIEGLGKLKEERSTEDLAANYLFSSTEGPINQNGDIRLRCYLNPTTNYIESAFIEADILLNQQKKVSISIAKIEE